MVKIRGSDYPRNAVSEKCATPFKSILKKRIDTDATGDKTTNRLLEFLRCQVKADKTCKQVRNIVYSELIFLLIPIFASGSFPPTILALLL